MAQSPDKKIAARKQAEEAELTEIDDDEEDDANRGLTASKGRATPSRRQREEEAEENRGNFLTRFVRNLRDYFEGVRSEVGKVVWPTREETRRLSTIVLIALIIASLILGTISGLFTELFRLALESPFIVIAFMVGGGIALWFIGRFLNAQQDTRY
jgi:preprotein translocase subunit SecE